jgi:hypothetical protein
MDGQYNYRLEKIEAVLDTWLPERLNAAWAAKIFPGLGGRDGAAALSVGVLQSLADPCSDLLSRGG